MSKKYLFRSPYVNPPSRCQIDYSNDSGCTKSEFKDGCNINNIMKKVTRTREMPPARSQPIYADYSAVGSLQEAYELIEDASAQFSALPPELRFRFNNNPLEFISFCEDEKNYDEMLNLGLIEKVPGSDSDEQFTEEPIPGAGLQSPGVEETVEKK